MAAAKAKPVLPTTGAGDARHGAKTLAQRAGKAGADIPGWIPIAILPVICLGFSVLRWLHMDSLWGAGALFLSHSARAFDGEMPYRDFATSHPPLAIWIFEGAYRLLGGPSYFAAQVVIDLLSTAIVLLIYAISVRLLPRVLALVAGILIAALSDSGFQLFSLQIYSPALLPGTIGIQMMIIGMMDRVLEDRRDWVTVLWIVPGCAIAVLAKPEFIGGAVACLTAAGFLVFHRHRNATTRLKALWSVALWPLVGLAAGFGIFFAFAQIAGPEKLMAGLTGYGLAAVACPWWPTGLGLSDAIGSLGLAAVVVAVLSLFRFRDFSREYGRYYLLGLALAILGGSVYVLTALNFTSNSQAAQSYFQTARLLGDRFGLGHSKALALASYVLTKRNLFLPVLWPTILLAFFLTWRLLFSRARAPKTTGAFYLLVVTTCGLSVRQLFGDYTEAFANVAVPAFPFLYILLTAFLFFVARWVWRIGRLPEIQAAGMAILVTIAVIGAYALPRAAAASIKEIRAGYAPLKTLAGTVNLTDPDGVAIYTYLRDHSSAGDAILDIGSNVGASWYGGGINFALRRKSPVASTIFTDIQPPDWLLKDDVARFRAAAPKFVIGTDPLQSLYGLPNAWNRCAFPNIVWAPHVANFDREKRIPLIRDIQLKFSPVYRAGRWVVFAQRK